MKINKNKTVAVIAIFLMLSLVAFLPINNTAKAIDWFSWVNVSPNPVGIGQSVWIIFGITMPAQNQPNSYQGWILTITDPDGKNSTMGPINSDATGFGIASFTPDKIGNYTVQAYYPGGRNITYPASGNTPAQTYLVPALYSQPYTFTVQLAPLPQLAGNPVPTNYWQWPINSDNHEWYAIGANWLMAGFDTYENRVNSISGVFDPYSTAPSSSHIIWTKPWEFGGVVGGTGLDNSYYTGSNYREEVTPPIIINGRIYYNQVDPPAYGFYCVDLYTGKTIWFQNQTYLSGTGGIVDGTNAQLSIGQILIWDVMNQNGGNAYLWSLNGNTWARFDAYSGNLLNTIVNVTNYGVAQSGGNPAQSGTWIFGPNGELLVYGLDTTTHQMLLWNSSKVVDASYSQTAKYNIPWKNGIQWTTNVTTIPNEFITTWDPKNPTILISTNQSRGTPAAAQDFIETAYSTTDGHMMWRQTRSYGTWEFAPGENAMGDGMYVDYRKETRQLYAFNAQTGANLWVSDPRPDPLGAFLAGNPVFAYGKIYQATYDGRVYAYNESTGKVNWIFYDNSVNPSNLETSYGNYPYYGSIVVADGKVFVSNQEHTENSPLIRGENVYAINASNGDLVWSVNGHYKRVSIAGGYLVAPNENDGQIYCFGKGNTATTVEAPATGVIQGSSVVIKGTVTDQSPGQTCLGIPAAGTPAISDESMKPWMEYLYMQQQKPTNATGVPVSLDVIDSNLNYRHIGDTTSDSNGQYSFIWTPDIPGKYTLFAKFGGSESYFSSSSETAFYASAPTTTTSANPIVNPPPTETYFAISTAAIIAAIAIVGIVLAMIMLRKRP